jgi:hypothetical protein
MVERETIHRHRSERLLDRFIEQSHFETVKRRTVLLAQPVQKAPELTPETDTKLEKEEQ